MHTTLTITTRPLTIDDVVQVSREGRRVLLGAPARKAMTRARGLVEQALGDGKAHYGINTGFGSLSRQRIGQGDLRTLQLNLIRSHAAGIGEPLPRDVVRGMILLLAASLARGLSGIRPVVVQRLLDLLNAGITPRVPSIGSVGASGDLAPLAHVALVLLGEGEAEVGGRTLPGAKALEKAGITPLRLEAKEGLALINGTHLMAARGALLCADAWVILDTACLVLAMSIDACRASHSFLDDRLYVARNQPGPRAAARAVGGHLKGSAIRKSHLKNDPRVQDPYSLRAGATVLGASLETVADLERAIIGELGGVTDNPLVFARGRAGPDILSGANFHGMPLAIPLDALAIALCHVAGISERRTYLMTGAFEPESNLKPFLAPRPGLQSGLMIAQYTAAACVNEMISLAAPASVANIPTSAGMEDYNSFGPRGAAKAARAIELCSAVLAIEMICAGEGLDAHAPLASGKGVEAARTGLRRLVRGLTDDRSPSPDIERLSASILAGEFAHL